MFFARFYSFQASFSGTKGVILARWRVISRFGAEMRNDLEAGASEGGLGLPGSTGREKDGANIAQNINIIM